MESHSESNVALSSFAPDESLGLGFSVSKNAESSTNPQQPQQQTEDASESGTAGGGVGTFGASTSAGSALVRERRDIARGLVKDAFRDLGIPSASCTATATNVNDLLMADEDPTTAADLADDADGDDEATAMQTDLEASTNVTAAAAVVGGLPRESADAATAVAAASSVDPSNSMQSDGAADSVVSSKGGDAKEGSILGRGERGATPKVVAASAPPPPRELGEEEAARRIQAAYRRHVTGVDNKHEKEDEQAEVEAPAEDAPQANVAAAGDEADVPQEQCASLAWEADDAATTEDEAARTIQRALKQHLSKASPSISKQKKEATDASGKESEGGNGDDKVVTNSGAEAEVANNDEDSVPAAVEEAPPAASITADGKEEETKKTAANAPSPSLAASGDLQMQPSAVLRQLSADEAARRIQAAFRKSANGNAMCPTNAKAVYLSAQKEKSAVFSPVVAAAPEGGKEKRTTTIPRSRHPVASYPPVTAAPCDDDTEATSYQQQTPPAAVPEVAKAPAATTQQPQQQTATAAAAGPKKGTAFAKASDERRLEASYDEEAPLLNNDSSVSAAEKKENPHEEAARPLPPLPRGFGRLEWIDGLFASVAAQQRHRLGPKRSAITERALLPEGGDALLGAKKKNGSSPSRAVVATNGATTEGNSMDGDEREGLIDAAKLSDEAQHIRLFISRLFGLLSYAPSSTTTSEGNEGEKTMDANGLAVRRYANNALSTVEWTLATDVVEDAAIALCNSHSTSDLSADSHAQKKTAVALGAAIRRALAVIRRGKASRPAHGAQIVSPDRRVGLGVLSALLALVAQSTADAARLADLRAEGGHCRPPLTLPSQCLVVARLFCEALAAVTSVAAPTHAVERSSGQPVSRSVPCYTAVRNAFAIGDSTDGRTIDAETLRSLTSGAGSQFSPRGKEASSFVGFAAVADRLQSRFFTLPREKEQDEGEKANTSSTAAAVSRSKAIMRISCATNEVKPEESKASASALLRRRIKNECAARAALAANVETVFRRTVAPTLPPPLQVALDRAVDSSTSTSAKAATDVVEALKGFSETAAALREEAANAAAENTKAVVPPSPPSTGASPYTSTIGARIAARRINAGLGTKASFSPPATSAVAEQQPSPPAAAAAAPSPHSTLPCSAIPPSVGDVLKAIAAYGTTGLVGPNSLPFSSYALFSFCLCFILGHEEALGAHAPTVYKRVRAAIGRAMGGSAAASVSSFGDSFRNGIMDGTMSSYDAMGGTAAAQSAFALSTSLSPLRRRPATASTSTATATATTAAAALLGVSGQQASNTILYDSIFECFSDLVTSEAFAALLSECANGSPLWVAMSPAIVPIATFFASEKYIVPEVNTMNTSGGGAAAAENKDGSAASVGPQHCRALQRLLAALRTYLAVSSDGATLFLSPCGAVTRHRATASAAFEWITSVMRGLLVAAPQPPMLQSGADNGAEGEGMTPPFAAHPLAWLPLEAPVEKPCAQTWGLLASVVGRAVAGAAEASTHVTYMPIEESHSRVARHAAPTPLPSRRVESSSSGVIAPSPPRDYAADRRPQPQGGDYSRLQY